MPRTVGIGIQDFSTIITNDYFYIDKTSFIKEWWESGDAVTLITRPRRFGKTLTMSMVNYFFSNQCAERNDLFENLSIWQNEKYRKLQGTYPVIFVSFAGVKRNKFEETKLDITKNLADIYRDYMYLLEGDKLSDREKESFNRIYNDLLKGKDSEMSELSLNHLSRVLSLYYDKKVIILLDEYDTPL